MGDKIIKETKYFITYLKPDGSTYQVFKRQPVELNTNLERYTQPTDKTTVAPKIDPKVKDNAKNASEKYKKDLLATGEYIEYNGQLVHIPRNNTVITADTRTDWLRKKSQEDYLNHLRWEERRKQKELETKVGLGLGLGTGVALALATPAAPAVNMALTAYSAGSLANLYLDGTLGFNLETGINTLGLIPGLQSLKAATIPIWAPIATKTANALQMVPKWRPYLPKGTPTTVYRLGNLEMLDDYIESGVVRPMPTEKLYTGDLPLKVFTNDLMFNRGRPFFGNPELFDTKAYKAAIVGDMNNSSAIWKLNFHKGHKNIFEPYVNGIKQAPLSEFDIYTRAPFGFGWFKNAYNIQPINNTIPIALNVVTSSVVIQPVVQNGKTSLKFFERPSKLTEAERLGIPKGDRGNLTLALQQAIEDFALYKTSGQYRQTLKFTPDETDYRWTYANAEGPTFLKYFTDLGGVLRSTWGRMATPDLTGVLSYHINRNAAGYSANFPKPEGLGYPVGEAKMFLDGNNQKLILTAPRTDFFAVPIEEGGALQAIGNSLSNTIDKEIMRNFWINARKALRPGTYLSGDNGAPPLGSLLIQAYNSKKLHTNPYYERPIKELLVIRDGLSPDSYSSIIRLGTRDGSLRWGEGFTRWNNSAVLNNYIYQAYKDLMSGKITFDQYEKIFNAWSLNLGGKPLQYIIKGGIKRPVHPHPYIYSKKLGGKLIAKQEINNLI